MNPEPKAGDLVALKSGGPTMTVQEVTVGFAISGFTKDVRCQWFCGDKLAGGVFPVESLKPAEKSANE